MLQSGTFDMKSDSVMNIFRKTCLTKTEIYLSTDTVQMLNFISHAEPMVDNTEGPSLNLPLQVGQKSQVCVPHSVKTTTKKQQSVPVIALQTLLTVPLDTVQIRSPRNEASDKLILI